MQDQHVPAGRRALSRSLARAVANNSRISHDDHAGLDGVEQGFAERFGLRQQTGDHDVGLQLIGAAVEQLVLSRAAQIGEQEDFLRRGIRPAGPAPSSPCADSSVAVGCKMKPRVRLVAAMQGL